MVAVAELVGKKAAAKKAARIESARYAKELEQDIRDCIMSMKKNEQLFNLEVNEALVEAYIYERQALQCRYRYLLEKARTIQLRVKGV